MLRASRVLDPAEVRQFFRIIDSQADHRDGLIGDLLDAGRIDSGTLSVNPEPAEVAALVDRARTTFLSGGGGRQSVRIDLPPDLPLVLADERRIVQVLNNLSSNASRHSPESSSIHVGALRDGVHVAVSVADEGRGVPPERLPHLFRKYADVGGGEGGMRGFGLGLAICKGLVEAHRGRIRAESAGLGHGTRFTFTIPVADEPAAGAPTPARRRTSGGARETRILVVDDDPEMLRYVQDALFEAGYTPVLSGDAEELPAWSAGTGRALVLLDLLLPGTGGIELLEGVPELADLPVIFISAYGREETMVRALDAGAADYLVTPFSRAELTARVRAALRRRDGAEPFVLGDLEIDYERRLVTLAGRPLELTGQSGARAHLRQETPPQARRRRGEARLHPHRALGSATACPHRSTLRILCSVGPSGGSDVSMSTPTGSPAGGSALGALNQHFSDTTGHR